MGNAELYFAEINAYTESYMLLMGYSLENSLKAYALENYLKNDNIVDIADFTSLQKKVWKIKNGHDLRSLISNFRIELNCVEDSLLLRYQNFTMWAGKYHIPSNPEIFYENTYKDKYVNIKRDLKIIKSLLLKIKSSI